MTELVNKTQAEAALWAQRQRDNARLGWLFGAVALVLFGMALWKFRPF